jgi:phosphatidylglycerol---prolipoprotein diacylglyceryl transferase
MRQRIVGYLDHVTGVGVWEQLVPTSSILYGVTFLVLAAIFVRRASDTGLDRRSAIETMIVGGLGAFIGAKFLYALLHLESYLLLPSHVLAPGGTVSWGAYAGSIAAVSLLASYRKASVPRTLDVLASCLGLGPLIGRWSCFLNGDDYGVITHLPWGVRFPAGSFPYAAHVSDGIISHTETLSAAVHPTQLYLSLNGLLVFIIMTMIWKRWRHEPGLTFIAFWMLYPLSRFFLEFTRDEAPNSVVPFLTTSQLFCVLAIASTGIVVFASRRLTAIHHVLKSVRHTGIIEGGKT